MYPEGERAAVSRCSPAFGRGWFRPMGRPVAAGGGPIQENVLLICRFKAGASGAATSTAQLQAFAGGGSGLTKGELGNHDGNHAGLKSTPGFSLGIEVRVKAADPGMCDFPFRRESGAGNRIPGGFFAYVDLRSSSHWQGIVRKRPLLLLRCSVLARSRKQAPPRHERAKKEQKPVGNRHYN